MAGDNLHIDPVTAEISGSLTPEQHVRAENAVSLLGLLRTSIIALNLRSVEDVVALIDGMIEGSQDALALPVTED